MKFKKILGLLLAALLALSALSLVACGPGEEDTPAQYTVTFNYNYDGAPAATVQTVEEGKTVAEPTDPERGEYTFTGWYTEAACSNEFDFATAITANITLYAGWREPTGYIITFDQNYDGAEEQTVRIEEGQSVTRPEDPARDGYFFSGWYTDEDCTQVYDFSQPVTAAFTLYAGWTENTGNNSTATFYYNYEGAGVYTTQVFNTGEWISEPVDPARTEGDFDDTFTGYVFDGWFADEACTEEFDFNSRYSANTSIYASWRKVYTFEAEYTDLDGKPGQGYSGNTSGLGLIGTNGAEAAGASNGHYVTSLYYDGAMLEFDITSDRAISDATIVLRLSAEYDTVSFSGDEFQIFVNQGTDKEQEFGLTASFTGVFGVNEDGEHRKRPFSNHVVATHVSLQEGVNRITLVVNNDQKGSGGTMQAKAPMVDCIYVYTNASLSWEPKTSNIA